MTYNKWNCVSLPFFRKLFAAFLLYSLAPVVRLQVQLNPGNSNPEGKRKTVRVTGVSSKPSKNDWKVSPREIEVSSS